MGKRADGAKETAQEKALAEVAIQKMGDFKKRWLPLQRQFGADIVKMGKADSSQRRRAAGAAATDNAVAFDRAQGGLEAALTDAGAAPSSSRFKLASTGLDADQATSRGLGFAAADAEIDDAYVQGLSKLTAMARGQSSGAIKGLGDVAALSAQKAASDAQISAAQRAGTAELAGQAVGAGLSTFTAPKAAGLAGAAPPVGADWPSMNPTAPVWGGGTP